MATNREMFKAQAAAAPKESPLPPVPKLPAFLKEMRPDKAGEIDAYNLAWETFFKKQKVQTQ